MIDQDDLLPVIVDIGSESGQFRSLKEREKQVFCLLACGFSIASISRLVKCTASNISQMITRHDPNGEFYLTPVAKRKFMARLWEAKISEALLHMTPDKMEAAQLSALASVAAKGVSALSKISVEEEEPVQDPQKILDAMGGSGQTSKAVIPLSAGHTADAPSLPDTHGIRGEVIDSGSPPQV